MTLIDDRMADGSRHFASLPEIFPWEALRDYIETLPDAIILAYITDHITEFWIDFTFRDYKMSINNPLGDLWFFVTDPDCPDSILSDIISHCEKIVPSRY
jgi:hypothetical protein